MRAPLLALLAASAALVFVAAADAGPPPGICRHRTASQCETILGPYGATQFLQSYVSRKLGPPPLAAAELGCDWTKRVRVYRCEYAEWQQPGATTAPCRIEALVERIRKPAGWRFAWLVEGASCKGPAGS